MAEDELATVLVGEPVEVEASADHAEDWPLDEVCAAAVELAREALLAEAQAQAVGEHLSAVAEGPLVVTHYFAGHVPGYTGWRWAVTLTRAPDSDQVTVDETALLPDGDALLAPAWVPWKQRIQSGDLKAGDVMVTELDDPRLVPGLTDNDTPEELKDLQPPQWELGLGRVRMLSPEGRREAAHRWYREVGPRSAIARAADLHCASCGFLLLIGGPLGQAFGVCANGYSPVDGRVVAMTFGCGAHSETTEKPAVGVAEVVVDELGYDALPEAEDSEAAPGEEADADVAEQAADTEAAPAEQAEDHEAAPAGHAPAKDAAAADAEQAPAEDAQPGARDETTDETADDAGTEEDA